MVNDSQNTILQTVRTNNILNCVIHKEIKQQIELLSTIKVMIV